MPSAFRLCFLGALHIERDGQPVRGFRSRKALALLAYLAAQRQPVPREQLADLFWEGKSEAEGRANLSWVLNKLCALLPDCLLAERHTVQFQRADSYWLDTDTFEALAAQQQADSLVAAVELYRGEFLDGLRLDGCAEFDLWLVGERERWRQRAVAVLDELVAHHNARGAYEPSLHFARRLLSLEPWREETHRQVMRLLARNGQRSAALAQYEACRRTLAQELGIEPTRETTALYERIRAADSRRHTHGVPAQPTSFVGREKELDQVIGLLGSPDCRLLTLVGPGGIGKTRLAIQAATAREATFLEGVYFVPLAAVSSAEFLVSAIAEAIGFSFFGSQEPRTQFLNYLRGKEMLLILDNLEHLLEGSDLLSDILQTAPEVKLLATSRECLNLRWEQCFQVEGLECPTDEMAADRSWEDYSAVQLFRQAAQQRFGQFSLSACTPSAVIRICHLVEGMPLGIELAAAWVRTRTCGEIAQEIERDLGFLATSLRDVPARHKSMQAAFEHSWRLLTLSEQEVFTQLAVFRRGFSAEAASDVAGASQASLESLVNKSLVRCAPSGRFEMHELVRQYAAAKLAAAPQTQSETHDRHCAYYAAFLHRREADLAGAGAGEALAAIKAEAENIRAAWHWAVAQAKLKEIERSLNGLAQLYFLAGPFQEGEMLMRTAAERVRALAEKMDRPERDTQIILGRLLAEQARFLNKRGQYSQAVTVACGAIDLARATHSADLEAAGTVQWGVALWNQGSYEAARPPLEQALVLAQTTAWPQVEADSLYNLGLVCWHLGDYAGARDYLERALNLYRAIGDRQGESASLSRLGTISHDQHDYLRARTCYEQALRICREIGERHGESITLGNLGLACNQQGDYAEARACYEQALRISREMGDRRNEGVVLINLGYALNQQGDYDKAGSYYAQSLRIYREIGDRQSQGLALSCLGLLAHQLGNDKAACEHGQQALLMAQEIGNRRVEGYSLTRLGHALTGLGRLDEAAEIYRQALALRRELGQTNLVMESLAGLARVALAQNNLSRARTCAEEILNHLAVHSLDGADEPFRVYLTCYRVLRANRDPRAQTILDTAHRLLQERAAKISEQELRRSFLENVAAHREIMEDIH